MGYTLHVLSLLNWRAGKLEEAIQQAKRQILIAQKLVDNHYEVSALNTTSSYFTQSYKFDSANIYLDKALALLQKYPDTIQLSHVYLYKGYNILQKRDYLSLSANKETLDELLNERLYWNLKHINLEKTFDFKAASGHYPYYASIYNNLSEAYLSSGTVDDKILGIGYLYKT